MYFADEFNETLSFFNEYAKYLVQLNGEKWSARCSLIRIR